MGTLGTFTESKMLIGLLTALVLLESGYIFLGRHPINRFQPVDEVGYVAFDSATGRLCRTFRAGLPPTKPQLALTKPTPSSFDTRESSPKTDPILSAIRGGLSEAEFDKQAQQEKDANTQVQAEFIRGLPACVDIR